MFNNTEELILFIVAVPVLANGYLWMCIFLLQQYLDWKLAFKLWINTACDKTCMCGDLTVNHSCIGNHGIVTEKEWALKNMPELKMG